MNSSYSSVSSPGQRVEVYTRASAYLPDSSVAFSYSSSPSSLPSPEMSRVTPRIQPSGCIPRCVPPLCCFRRWPLVIPAVLRCAPATTRCYPRFPYRSVLHVTTFLFSLFYEFFMQYHRPQIDLRQRERGP